MSALAIRSSARSEPFRLGVAAILIGLVAGALTIGLVHLGPLKAVAGIILTAGLVWFGTTRHPQVALALILLYLGLLDGYLKLATGSSYVTFIRDALLYSLSIGLLVRAIVQRRPLSTPPLSGWVIAFIVLVLIQVLNPNDGSLKHSIAGLRQNLEFVPLFWLTYSFVRSTRALRALALLLTFVAVANGIVTYAQYKESPAQVASWGPGYAERVLGQGQFALGGRTFYGADGQQFTRPFGLMSDAGTGGLVCAYALGCVFAFGTVPGRRKYLVPALAVGTVLVEGMITSQGRSVIIAAVVVAMAYGAMIGNSRFRGRFMTLFAVLGVAGLVYFGATEYLAGSASRDSSLSASQLLQTASTSRGVALAAIPYNLAHYPLGSGLGSGGPAAGQSGAPPDTTSGRGVNAETEISLATLETGIPGLLVVVGFTSVLLIVGIRRIPNEPDPEARSLLAALIAPLSAVLVLFWVSPLMATTPTGPYVFGVAGIISYWLIERRREHRSAQPGTATLRLGRAHEDSVVAG